MFLWFFVLPELLPEEAGRWLKRDLPYPEFFSAIMCLGLYTAARIAEQVRSGIASVPPGLGAAARASGLSLAQTYRYVLLPLGFRIIVPPLTSELLGIFKNTSIALTIGVMEITASSREVESYTFQGYEAFAAATTAGSLDFRAFFRAVSKSVSCFELHFLLSAHKYNPVGSVNRRGLFRV